MVTHHGDRIVQLHLPSTLDASEHKDNPVQHGVRHVCTRREAAVGVKYSIMEKNPNQQDRNSARCSSFLDSNPKNPVQPPIVDM